VTHRGSLARTLVRNAVAGGGARAITLVVGLLMTPYVLHRLGEERFGIWALTTVITGFAGVLDLSFKSSFVKFLAELHARGDRVAHDRVVAISVTFYAVFGVVLVVLFAALGDGLLELLRIPVDLRAEAFDVFLIALVGTAIGGVLSVFPAVCDARQRIDLTNGLGIVCLLLSAAVTIVVLEMGGGLRAVALAQLFGVVIFHAGSVVLAWTVVGPIRPSLSGASWAAFRRQFAFGLKLHVSSMCSVVNRQLDKLLLSRWAGLGSVASYEVGLRIAANAGSFQPYLAATLLPAASQLDATGDRDRLISLYHRASRYLFLVGVPGFVFLAVHAQTVITAWLGAPEPMAARVLQLLAAGYMMNSLSNAMAFVCQGIGRPDIQAWQSALQLVANIVLSALLLWLIGPLGAPAGTSLALIFGAAVFAARFHPVLGTSTAELLRSAALTPLALSAAAALGSWAVAARLEAVGRADAVFELILAGVVFMAVYLAGCWRSRSVGREELAVLRSALAGVPVETGRR
jgi:O-antigen/teichoic acid export membrane protein